MGKAKKADIASPAQETRDTSGLPPIAAVILRRRERSKRAKADIPNLKL